MREPESPFRFLFFVVRMEKSQMIIIITENIITER